MVPSWSWWRIPRRENSSGYGSMNLMGSNVTNQFYRGVDLAYSSNSLIVGNYLGMLRPLPQMTFIMRRTLASRACSPEMIRSAC